MKESETNGRRWRLREFRPGDGAAMTALFRRSVEALGARDYAPRQIGVWAGAAPGAEIWAEWAAQGRRYFLAFGDDGALAAFAGLERGGHIDFLYAAPEAAGQGAAAAVYQALEAAARETGIAMLHAEASETARRFFERRGFRVTARRDIERGGVAIHNYAVEKPLAGRERGAG